MTIDIPDNTPADVADRLEAIAADVLAIDVENRRYILSATDAPNGADVQMDRHGLEYYVPDDETVRQRFDAVAAYADGDDIVITAHFNGRKSFWTERGHDFAAAFWDALEQHGVDRPAGDRRYGVKFDGGDVTVDNVWEDALA